TGLHSLLDSARTQAPVWADRLPKIPGLMFATLEQLRSGQLKVQTDDAELRNIRAELKQVHNRLVYALIGAGALIGAAVMQAIHGGDPIMLGPAPLSAWLLGLVGVVALAFAWRD
ncbi:MAG: hypothetical protein HKO62_02430, partial [Gammaproteobacteria bacterium]|nr:hypothetical protein [Gammaproteobacteria bacterium]